MATEYYPKDKAAKEFVALTDQCSSEWLPATGLRCTLSKGHPSMHWAKYRIDYEKVELSGEGEIFWNGEEYADNPSK